MSNNTKSLNKLLDFFTVAGKLKKAIRFSAAKKIKGDSSADHSWRVALMTFAVAKELGLRLDIEKAIKIALVHDIAEGIAGEIDYRLIHSGKITRKEKKARERIAMRQIRKIASLKTGKEIFELWQEYEIGKTRESKFVRALDKIETTIHLLESGYKTYDWPELIAMYPNEAVNNFPELKEMLIEIKKKLKKEFKKGKFAWKKEYDDPSQ